MDFGWTDAQSQRYQDALAAVRDGFDAGGGFDADGWRRLGELGVLGACVPPEHGGAGLGAVDTALLYEAVGRGCADTGLVFAAAAHLFACAMPIAEFGGAALRERWLPGLCSGEHVGANAITEPDAGSDVARLATTAVPAPGGYVLDGEKSFVSNAPVADVVVTYARTDPAAGHLGVTGFAVPTDHPGVLVGPPMAKLGLDGCAAATVTFRDCFVPAQDVLGAPGQGMAVFQHSMGWERACLFATYLGLQERLIERCVAHARAREQFGRRIGQFQAVSHRIAEMRLRADGARLLLHRACWAMDRGEPDVLFTALAKLATSEAALATALDAVRIFGGRGYLRDHGVEAALRDAVGGTIFSGTSDVQRELVAWELGL